MELGLSAVLHDAQKKSFDISFCMQSHKGEFLGEELKCFDRSSTRAYADRLPQKITFLDGEISILAISQEPGGGWRLRYTVSKPITATAVTITQSINGHPFAMEKDLQWLTPAKEK